MSEGRCGLESKNKSQAFFGGCGSYNDDNDFLHVGTERRRVVIAQR